MMFRRILLPFAAAAAWTACSSDPTGAGDVLVVSVIEIDPPGAGLIVGGTQQLQATPRTASGIPVPNRQVTWSSRDPDIATVTETGLVAAVSFGETEIVAQVDNVAADVPVNVSLKPVAQVIVNPTSATIPAGQSRQLQVTLKASDGSILSNRTITYLSDDPEVASVSNGLVTGVSAGQTIIRVRSEGKEGTSSFTITPRPAVKVAFIQQPQDGQAGVALEPVKVALQDETGATVIDATDEVTISLAENPGDATLSGDLTVAAVAGVATFSDLKLNRPASGYRLRAASGSLTVAVSNAFTIAPGPPAALLLAIPPSEVACSGDPLEQQPVIQLVDGEGNEATTGGVQVRAELIQLTGTGTLGGATTVPTDANGVARFTELQITGAGTYQLRFTSSGLDGVVSSSIAVVLCATALRIEVQPPSIAVSGVALLPFPEIQLLDRLGDPVAIPGVLISASIASGPGSVGGITVVETNASGKAIFGSLSITGPGQHTLRFSAPDLPSVVSREVEVVSVIN